MKNLKKLFAIKKLSKLGFILILVVSLVLSACSNDDDGSPENNTQQISEIENQMQSGTWRITNYNDSGEDETSDFNGYDFSFNSDGSLVAINGTITRTGNWSVTNESSSSSSSSNDNINFNIFFPLMDSNDFGDLTDDWGIISTSSTIIELIDVSSDNGSTDLLKFEKN